MAKQGGVSTYWRASLLEEVLTRILAGEENQTGPRSPAVHRVAARFRAWRMARKIEEERLDLERRCVDMEAVLGLAERTFLQDQEGTGISWPGVHRALGVLAERIIETMERVHRGLAMANAWRRQAAAIPETAHVARLLAGAGEALLRPAPRKGYFGDVQIEAFSRSQAATFGTPITVFSRNAARFGTFGPVDHPAGEERERRTA